MIIETSVGNRNEVAIETPLVPTGFVATHKDDRSAGRVKSEGNTPLSVAGPEPELFQIRVARTAQRVHVRPAKMRPIGLKILEHGG